MRRFPGLAARLAGLGIGQAEVELPPEVRVERDVAYGNDASQRLDVYRPQEARAAPVILFVHGGGWRRGDKAMARMVRHKMPHWTGRGAVFVSANHRLLPQAGPLAQAEDVASALAFAQREAERWGADPRRVVLMGHSAGAHLVSLLTADAGMVARHGVQPWLATVALDTAVLDVENVMSRPHYGFYDPVFGADARFWREASPMHRMTARPAVPMLLVCSSDRDDSCAAAQAFAAKARGFGAQVTVLPVTLNHMEINDRLGVPGAYTDAVDAFLQSVGVR